MACGGRQNADDALALALATGKTLRAAAEAAGVSERTGTRRWGDPNFRRKVFALRGELLGCALGRLVDASVEAVDVLRGLLQSEHDSVKLSAARALLEHAPRFREYLDLEQRLTDLEGRLKTP
jgi:hypothetical protein